MPDKSERLPDERERADIAIFDDDDNTSTHFLPYFLLFIVVCITGYIIFHNRKKVCHELVRI